MNFRAFTKRCRLSSNYTSKTTWATSQLNMVSLMPSSSSLSFSWPSTKSTRFQAESKYLSYLSCAAITYQKIWHP